MRSLYQINSELEAIIDYDGILVNEDTGEVIDEAALEALQLEREEKIEGVGLGVKNMRAEALAIDAEIKALKKRKEALEKKADGWADYLTRQLAGEKFKTARLAIAFRKSVAVAAVEGAEIPEEYKRVKTVVEADKTAIKKALQAGEEVPGYRLQENLNIQIK